MTVLHVLLLTALMLVGIGIYGLLMLRNLIRLVIALQILIKGVAVALVAAGIASGQVNLGQSLAVTVIFVDTIVAVIGLALAIQVQRQFGTLDAARLAKLKR